MPSTYLSLHYHVVFATKLREPLIEPTWRTRLHEYIGGTVRGLGGHPDGIGGTADHVHVLLGLRATHCLADVMRDIKKASSFWVHREIGLPGFGWQEGYAAFTVGAPARDGLRRYIDNQEAHHRIRPFRDELIDMLRTAEVEYDSTSAD